MFKLLFNDSESDEIGCSLVDNSTLGYNSGPSSSDAIDSLSSGTNIYEYDPLDMSDPFNLPIDEYICPAAGNTSVCEYDPLNYSDPNEMSNDEDEDKHPDTD